MPSPANPDFSELRAIFARQRAAAGLTIDELAERTELARDVLNLSAGRFRDDLRTWLLLARAFEVSLDDVLASVWEGLAE